MSCMEGFFRKQKKCLLKRKEDRLYIRRKISAGKKSVLPYGSLKRGGGEQGRRYIIFHMSTDHGNRSFCGVRDWGSITIGTLAALALHETCLTQVLLVTLMKKITQTGPQKAVLPTFLPSPVARDTLRRTCHRPTFVLATIRLCR